MNKLITILLFIFFSSFSYAKSYKLVWATIPDAVGYYVYWGDVSNAAGGFSAYRYKADVGNTLSVTIDVKGETRDWYFAVTSYDGEAAESGYSIQLYSADCNNLGTSRRNLLLRKRSSKVGGQRRCYTCH